MQGRTLQGGPVPTAGEQARAEAVLGALLDPFALRRARPAGGRAALRSRRRRSGNRGVFAFERAVSRNVVQGARTWICARNPLVRRAALVLRKSGRKSRCKSRRKS